MKADPFYESLPVPIFSEFGLWRGYAPANFDVTFLGQRTDVSFNSGWADAERTRDREAQPPYPTLSEETFEWIALFRAILEAHQSFTMIELGAGYGRWLVAAACAVRRRRPELGLRLMGVEAEPTHFRWLLKHFVDNNLRPEDHYLIEAAVGTENGEAFLTREPDPAAVYGQRLVTSIAEARSHGASDTFAVRTFSLASLLTKFDFVDLIDMDIQGAELDVISAAGDNLATKVKRIHIGTHSHEIESGLRNFFGPMGWHCESDFSCLGKSETLYGCIDFGDGVQTWINPKLSDRSQRVARVL
jgi:FkbM family methyltransferase